MNEKKITLSFDLEQVANDVLAKCNLISKNIKDEALEDIRASVQEPDDPETRSIINRSVTEAFGNVKVACQRYLRTGRTADDNLLEQMVKNITYVKKIVIVQDTDDEDRPLFNCTVSTVPTVVYTEDDGTTWKDEETGNVVVPDDTPEPKMVEKTITTDEIDEIEYETIVLELYIPNFNTSVTDGLKSQIHKYVVDYIMGRFLQDQVAEKAAEYKTLADGEDYKRIVKLVNTRESYTARKPSWV